MMKYFSITAMMIATVSASMLSRHGVRERFSFAALTRSLGTGERRSAISRGTDVERAAWGAHCSDRARAAPQLDRTRADRAIRTANRSPRHDERRLERFFFA